MNRHPMRHFTVPALSALLCASTLAVAPAAFAAITPGNSGWKCQEYVATQDFYQPKVFFWSNSHARGGSADNPTVGVERVEGWIPLVMEDCQKNTGASLPQPAHLSRNENLARHQEQHYMMGD